MTETDIVSGAPTKGRETYRGAWPIAYKASPFELQTKEYGYNVKVNYWSHSYMVRGFMTHPGSLPLGETVINPVPEATAASISLKIRQR